MANELHIELHPDVFGPAEDILADFPFDTGQSIVSHTGSVIVISLGDADDTNYMQDWYLNSNEDVMSFYVVED